MVLASRNTGYALRNTGYALRNTGYALSAPYERRYGQCRFFGATHEKMAKWAIVPIWCGLFAINQRKMQVEPFGTSRLQEVRPVGSSVSWGCVRMSDGFYSQPSEALGLQ